jgi:hypothetical protein
MVEATASSVNSCGNPTAASPELAGCLRQEPTYDIITSSFIVPEPGENITVQVCNNTIYALNQFVEFLAYDGLKMRIISIQSDKTTMILQNGCANGAYITNNPTSGLAVGVNSQFVVVDSHSCVTSSESNDIVQQGLSDATALCTPNLTEPESSTVVYQVTGRTESDPFDTALQKCIKRVKGFFFSLGAPRCPNITELVESDNFAYREVRADKTSGQFKVRKLIGEHAGTVAASKYIMAGNQSAEKPIGPAFVYSPFDTVVDFGTQAGSITNIADYATIAVGTPFVITPSVNVAAINNLLNKNLQDHYYLYLHVIVMIDAATNGATRFLEIKLNDVNYAVIIGRASNPFSSSQAITVPIKILNTDTTFSFKLVATGDSMKYFYKITGLGAYI